MSLIFVSLVENKLKTYSQINIATDFQIDHNHTLNEILTKETIIVIQYPLENDKIKQFLNSYFNNPHKKYFEKVVHSETSTKISYTFQLKNVSINKLKDDMDQFSNDEINLLLKIFDSLDIKSMIILICQYKDYKENKIRELKQGRILKAQIYTF